MFGSQPKAVLPPSDAFEYGVGNKVTVAFTPFGRGFEALSEDGVEHLRLLPDSVAEFDAGVNQAAVEFDRHHLFSVEVTVGYACENRNAGLQFMALSTQNSVYMVANEAEIESIQKFFKDFFKQQKFACDPSTHGDL